MKTRISLALMLCLIMATLAVNSAPPVIKDDVHKWVKPHTAQPAIFLTTNSAHATGCTFSILGTSYPLRYFSGFGIPPTCGNPNYPNITLQTFNTYTVNVNDGVIGWTRTVVVSSFQSCMTVDLN